MKKLFFLLLAAPLIAAGCNSQTAYQPQSQTQSSTQGRVVLSVTDAAANLQNISSVQVTIDKTELHSDAQGWVTASSQTKTFDLLQLKASASAQLLADAQIQADTYNQIRLHVQKVMVTQAGTTSEAKLPSNTLKFVGKVVVNTGNTANVTVDFMLDKSLHITGAGKFILTPVIKLTSESSASVNISANGTVTASGGNKEDEETLGMNESGELEQNFELKEDGLKLDLTSGGSVEVMTNGTSDAAAKISAQKAIDLAVQSGNIDLAISVKLETVNGKKTWHVIGTQSLVLKNVFVDASTGAIVSVN